MSGHSKWASIKHQKAVADSRRGQAFTKLANQITIAAKQGGPDPAMNARLRLAIAKAKQANMPNANVERAIQKAAGAGADQVEEILYEGYGPGGVAILIQVATDNRNRAAAEVRSTLTKHGGRLGESGSVAYQFDQKGMITIKTDDKDAATLAAIDSGAEDVEEDEVGVTVYTAPNQLDQVRQKLVEAGYEPDSAELTFTPKTPMVLDEDKAASVMKLMNTLEDLDDVAATYTNF
jgi:YebC/PmpR family DNA-binding regulatory protein